MENTTTMQTPSEGSQDDPQAIPGEVENSQNEIDELKAQLERLEFQVETLTAMLEKSKEDAEVSQKEDQTSLKKYKMGDFVEAYNRNTGEWTQGKVITPGKDYVEVTTARGPINVGHPDNIRKQK